MKKKPKPGTKKAFELLIEKAIKPKPKEVDKKKKK